MADGPKRGMAVNKQKLCEILGWNREAFDRQVRDGMPVAERPSGRGGDYVLYTGDVIRWLVERALGAAGHRSAERRRKRLGVCRSNLWGSPLLYRLRPFFSLNPTFSAMPRQSVEARSAAGWRSRPRKSVPQPPEHLSPKARKFWARILASKPSDWFEEGNLPILAQYCDLVAEQAKMVLRRNELDVLKPVDGMERTALVQARINMNRAIREHALAATTLGVKLRLTVQNTIDRRSGMLDEKPPEVVAQRGSVALVENTAICWARASNLDTTCCMSSKLVQQIPFMLHSRGMACKTTP